MSKDLLLRIYEDQINVLYSDVLTTLELERVVAWAKERISQKKAMEPKREA